MQRFLLTAYLFVPFVVCVAPRAAWAQEETPPGQAVVGLQFYRDSIVGSQQNSLGGLRVDLRQLLPQGGMLAISTDTVYDGSQTLLGKNVLEFRDLPWGETRTSFGAGTLLVPLDSLDHHFTNLIPPSNTFLGAEARIVYGPVTFSLVAGRSMLYFGPGIPFLRAAPDKVAAFTTLYQPNKQWKLEGRAVLTTANEPVPFLGITPAEAAARTPRASQGMLFDSEYEWKPGFYWLGEAGLTHATPQRGTEALATSGTSASFFGGPYILRKRYRFEADYAREGINYYPLTNQFIGDRQGSYVGGDYRLTQRLSLFGGLSDSRNNVEDNPHRPTLSGTNGNLGASWALPKSFTVSFSDSYSSLKTVGAGANEKTTVQSYALQATRPLRSWLFSYRLQHQSFSSPVGLGFPGNALTSHELQTLHNLHRFGSVDGLFRIQDNTGNGLHGRTLFGQLGGTVVLGSHFSLYGRGEFGRDLSNETLFALNTMKTAEAGLKLRLPSKSALNVHYFSNSLITTPNQANLFFASSVAGVPVMPIFSLAHSVFMLEISKSFNWGHGELPPEGLPPAELSRYIPAYGIVDGYVYNDRNGNGQREADEEGLPYVTVVLDDRSVQTDQQGHFEFDRVIVGRHQFRVPEDKVPANYSLPHGTEWMIEVRQNMVTPLGVPLQVLSSVRGHAELYNLEGKRLPLANLRVVLMPGAQATLTDADGTYAFDNLMPGAYDVTADPGTLPISVKFRSPSTYHVRLISGRDAANVNFTLQEVTIERPIERVPIQGGVAVITVPTGAITRTASQRVAGGNGDTPAALGTPDPKH